MNNDDNEMIACAQTLRAAVNNETEVTVTRRVAISNYNAAPVHDWCIYKGDDRSRELARLKESAAKLGLQLVEAQP